MHNAIRVVWAGMITQTILIMNMLISWSKVNFENVAYLPHLLLPSMYVFKLCCVVLKLEVNNFVACRDFFLVIFFLANLIFNIWTCKTY